MPTGAAATSATPTPLKKLASDPSREDADVTHTPGPWTIKRYGDGNSLVIHSNHVNRVCFMATPGSHGDPATIAADARLIAAAPDMLAALEAAERAIDDCQSYRSHLHFKELDQVRAAISRAKAKGE